MPVNRWRGDAPSASKILTLFAPDPPDVFCAVSVGNKRLEFTEWNASTVLSRIQAAAFPELAGISITRSGDNLIFEGPVNTDFDVRLDVAPSVAVANTPGRSPVNQQTLLNFAGATGGTFKLTCNGKTTGSITLFTAGALNTAGVVTAINALASFASGDVTAAVRGAGIVLTWAGGYAANPVSVSIDGKELDNGGAVVIAQTLKARPATNDIWLLGTQQDFEFTISEGVTAVTVKSNETEETLAAKLTAAWGGRVDIYRDRAGTGLDQKWWVLDMKGFAGTTTTLTVGSVAPSGQTPSGVSIDKIYSRGDTSPSEIFLFDFRSGPITVNYLGTAIEFGAADTGSEIVAALNSARDFQAWSDISILHSAGTAVTAGSLAPNLMVLSFDGDVRRTSGGATLGGVDKPDSELVQTGGAGVLRKLQDGGPTNAADGAVHSVSVVATDLSNQAGLGGSFKLTFPEGTTAAISVGASAATVETAVEAATGFGVGVTGTGTPVTPYLIDYTGDLTDRELPTVTDKKITGDGTATLATSRAAQAGVSASAIVKVSATADGGTYKLAYGSAGSVSMDFDESAADFLTKLQTFPELSVAFDVVVTLNAASREYVITFAVNLANQPVGTFYVPLGGNSLADSNTANDTRVVMVPATGPSNFAEPLNWSLGRIPHAGDELVINESQGPISYGLRQFQRVAANTTTNTLTATVGHDFRSGQVVQFLLGSVAIGGLSAGTDYYITDTNLADGTFRVSASLDGTPVNLTAAGTGPHYCGVLASDVSIGSSFTEAIGLPLRNDGGYQEYLERFLSLGIESSGEISVGDGDGTGSGLLRINTGNSAGQIRVASTSQSQVLNIPPLLIAANSNAVKVLVIGGDAGIAVYDDETALLGSVRVISGSLQIGSATIAGNLIAESGLVRSKRLSVTGLVQLR